MGPRTFLAVVVAFLLAMGLVHRHTMGSTPIELGAYSDEPAHYVTGLMVRDYLGTALGTPPMAFAQEFYERFPKVALGNWPPGFYLLQSAWFLVVDDDPGHLVLYVRGLAALTAALLALLVARATTPAMGVLAGGLWLARPLTLALSGVVMTEVPLALATVAALVSWTALTARPSGRRAAGWALIAGGAVLIKSSAIGLLAVPATARRLPWQARWMALAGCAAVAGPWTVLFRDQARAGWLNAEPSWAYTVRAVPYYTSAMPIAIGWMGVAGLALWLVSAARTRSVGSALERGSAWLVLAWLVVMWVVPAGFEVRHTLPIAIPCLALAAVGVHRATAAWRTSWRAGLVAAVTLAVLVEPTVKGLPSRRIEGYRAAVDSVAGECHPGCVVLVVSDPQGEGAVVAAAATLRHTLPLRIVRGSKVLSRSDWAGRAYQPVVRTPAEASQLVRRLRLTHVLLDESPPVVTDAVPGELVREVLRAAQVRTLEVTRLVRHPGHQLDHSGPMRVVTVPRPLQ